MSPGCTKEKLERAKGIEPSYAAWEAAVLPLNYARKPLKLCGIPNPISDFSLSFPCQVAGPIMPRPDLISTRNAAFKPFRHVPLMCRALSLANERAKETRLSARSCASRPLRKRIPRTLHVQCRSFLRTRLCQWLSLRMMVLIAGRACTAIAFVFRKACSRACRSSFALGCRPLSRYFCK
jgi:hypothetical protein